MLSSPEGDANYYSELMNVKDKETGKPFFRVVDCFQICKACLKLERTEQIKCNHIKNTAHWLDQRKVKKLKALYAANPEDAMREFQGLVVSDYTPCFHKLDIDRLFSRPTAEVVAPPKQIVVACDPNGGGPSEMSMASGYYDKTGCLVVRYSVMYNLFAMRTVSSTMLIMLNSENGLCRVSVINRSSLLQNLLKCSTHVSPHTLPMLSK